MLNQVAFDQVFWRCLLKGFSISNSRAILPSLLGIFTCTFSHKTKESITDNLFSLRRPGESCLTRAL